MSEEPKMFEAKVSSGRKLLGKRKAKRDPDFDFETYIADAQEAAQKRADLLNELAPALMKKFRFDENEVEKLLTSPSDTPELIENGIGYSVTVMRRFASDLLNDNSLALEVVAQWRRQWHARDKFAAIGALEIRRLMSEAGTDPDTFSPHEPFRDEWSEFYHAAQETSVYKEALANAVIQRARYADAFQAWITQGKSQPKPLAHQIETAIEFSFHTSQEFNALSLAQCDGKTFTSYTMNEQAGAIIHERDGSPHRIRMELTDDERAAGLALGYLESLARAQDADAVLATAYILGVLAPPPHLPARVALGWINFDDVLSKIGWIPRNTKDRRELHAKIWNFVKFGERAQIIGKRTGAKYKDAEDNEIDTTIHGAAWRVMKTETPDPPALYAALETPVCAEIVVSKELTALISNPKTAQYFQCGEVLGAIPGGKPAGAWARVIGLALLSFWRRKPREYSAGILKPTRRELLSHYAAKIAPYDEILASDKPGRAIDYWCGALQILADEGFIERTGEAAITPKEMRDGLPRQNWQDLWLDQSINIEVGAKTKPAFEKVLKPQFALKPRDLKKKPRAKKRPKSRQQTGGV